MSKWIAEFELEDGDTMPEHMDLEYKGVRIDFHCKPQEPTTKNDLGVDAISRAQAQTKIEMNASRYTIARECGGMGQVEWSDQLIKVSDAVDIIRHLPSVTPQEPRKGHWIEHEWEEMREKGYYRCSVCNHGYQRYTKGIRKSDVPYIDGQEYKLWNCDNYCPNCGAKMVEPQESEDKE